MTDKPKRRNGFVLKTATVVMAVLLLLAASSEAAWLSRGVGVGGVYRSLKKNMGDLIDSLGDISSAAVEGDAEEVEKIWQEVKKTPGKIIKEAFPVLKAGDAGVAVRDGVQRRVAVCPAKD